MQQTGSGTQGLGIGSQFYTIYGRIMWLCNKLELVLKALVLDPLGWIGEQFHSFWGTPLGGPWPSIANVMVGFFFIVYIITPLEKYL